MAEKKYSEDYEKLLLYKRNVSAEIFPDIKEETVDFFFEKYKDNINNQYKYLGQILSRGVSFEGKLDFEEALNFSLEIPPQTAFDEKIKEKYIPQALNSFKPEIITNKHNYCFASYLRNYFRHAVRDLAGQWRKNMSSPDDVRNLETAEEKIIEEEEAAIIRKKISELKKALGPVEQEILAFLMERKKQKDMILINEESGLPYSKGYISKLVKKVRTKMRELLAEQSVRM